MKNGGYGFHPVWTNIVDYVAKADVEKIKRQVSARCSIMQIRRKVRVTDEKDADPLTVVSTTRRHSPPFIFFSLKSELKVFDTDKGGKNLFY